MATAPEGKAKLKKSIPGQDDGVLQNIVSCNYKPVSDDGAWHDIVSCTNVTAPDSKANLKPNTGHDIHPRRPTYCCIEAIAADASAKLQMGQTFGGPDSEAKILLNAKPVLVRYW